MDIGAVESSFSVIVVTNAAAHFLVSVPTSVRAGTPFNFTVSALDVSNTVVSGYRGTAHFTSTDGAASLPVNYTFVAGDNGVHTFTAGATLRTAGMQAITATDTVTAPLNGTSSAIEVLDLKIVVAPIGQTVAVGANVIFNVGVSGTVPFAYQWFANNLLLPGETSSALTVSNVTLLTPANYRVIITNAWGSVTSSVAILAVADGSVNFRIGTVTLNPATGLYEEPVTVTNNAGNISGLRFLVGNLPSRVTLQNVAGTNNGFPYAQFAVTMTNGQTGTFLLQFLNPLRQKFTNTVQVVALTTGSGSTPNTTIGITISQVVLDNAIPGSPRFSLVFTSVSGRSYQVLYSDDTMQTWTLASTLTASGTWTVWTELLPPATGSRFFKVILLPPTINPS